MSLYLTTSVKTFHVPNQTPTAAKPHVTLSYHLSEDLPCSYPNPYSSQPSCHSISPPQWGPSMFLTKPLQQPTVMSLYLTTSVRTFHVPNQTPQLCHHRDPHFNISALEPSDLTVLKHVREITGYLLIQSDHENFTDLSFLSSLEIINGRELEWVGWTVVVWCGIRASSRVCL